MIRKLFFLPAVLGLMAIALSACAASGPAGAMAKAVLSGELTDAAIAELAVFDDKALDLIDKTRTALAKKLERLDRAVCLFPLPAQLRYVRRGEAELEHFNRNCPVTIETAKPVIKRGGDPKPG